MFSISTTKTRTTNRVDGPATCDDREHLSHHRTYRSHIQRFDKDCYIDACIVINLSSGNNFSNSGKIQRGIFLEYIFINMTTKEHIIAVLKSHKPELLQLGVQTIGLFGSYVRNEQSGQSDIDLLIDFEPGKENFDNYMAAYDMFENLFTNEKVEVVTKNGLSPYIGPEILKDVVYV
jgi:uncharacterized protein